jgi:hypothetical protein
MMVQGVKMRICGSPDSAFDSWECEGIKAGWHSKASHSLTTNQDDELNCYMCRVGQISFVCAYCRLLVVSYDGFIGTEPCTSI